MHRKAVYVERSKQAQGNQKEESRKGNGMSSMTDFMTLDEIKAKLVSFEHDPTMRTDGRYSPSAVDWPDNILPFSEIHLAYLRKNKAVNPAHYLSNLELMVRIPKGSLRLDKNTATR